MKRLFLLALVALGLSIPPALAQPSMSVAPAREMKIAFDITNGNPKAILGTLETIDKTRKQLMADGIAPKIVLAFRGDASYFTQTDEAKIKPADRPIAAKIAAKIRELREARGVEALEQCTLPLAPRKIRPADVMPEVKVVPNGWISLAHYQQLGYSYIVP